MKESLRLRASSDGKIMKFYSVLMTSLIYMNRFHPTSFTALAQTLKRINKIITFWFLPPIIAG